MQNLLSKEYENIDDATLPFKGVQFKSDELFKKYLKEKVSVRLLDLDYRKKQIDIAIQGLKDAGFSLANFQTAKVQKIFQPNFVIENWLIGEFLVESILEDLFGVKFYYNHLRDAKNPNAKQTGTDIIGFFEDNGECCFVFGEVKTSDSDKTPPASVNKRHAGLKDQLKDLANTDNNDICNLIQWLQTKAQSIDGEFKQNFLKALGSYLGDQNKIKLYGCLVRDTNPDDKDLRSSAKNLKNHIKGSMKAEFLAIYSNSKMKNESWIKIVKEVLDANS
jgi:hypothetical protein